MIRIALPKGRLGDQVYEMLAGIGYDCPALMQKGRKLVLENPAAGVSYVLVKPTDVAVYVERGAVDLGVCGKDTLCEAQADVYELCDLGVGKCCMAVAAPRGYQDDPRRQLRVATKYPHIAAQHYAALGREIDIIPLHGSIELAPLLGMADVIVDIVETGATLRENDLTVVKTLFPISARLIANRSSYQFHQEQFTDIVKRFTKEDRT